MIDLLFLLKFGFISLFEGFFTMGGACLALLIFRRPLRKMWK